MIIVSIIIPIYNEAKTVTELLTKVYDQGLTAGVSKEMILIESHSTDATRELVTKFVESKKSGPIDIKLILQDQPLGKGYAVREGLSAATGDIVLIQDGDLEYDVADYPMLIDPIIDGHADFVLGSRHLSAGTWKIRHFDENTMKSFFMNLGGVVFHTMFNIVYGVKLTDPTTMYKVFKMDCIKGVTFESNRFDFDWELVAKLIRLGFNPLEVPISYSSRGFNDGKKIRIFRDAITYIIAIIKFRLCKIKRTPSGVKPRVVLG